MLAQITVKLKCYPAVCGAGAGAGAGGGGSGGGGADGVCWM